jgi:glutaredoxin
LSKAHVIVYSRPGCHLCDDAIEAIKAARCDEAFTFAEVNIETSPELLSKYQFDIPVIMINDVEAFRHRVDTKKFKELLRSAPN